MCNSIEFFQDTGLNLVVYHMLKKKPVETLVSEKYFFQGFLVDKCCNEGMHEKYCQNWVL